MRGLTAAVCLVSVVLLGAAPAGLPPDMRERFSLAVAAHKAGDWSAAAREFADPVWAGTPLEDYALLYRADSVLRQGDTAAARALAAEAAQISAEGVRPLSGVRSVAWVASVRAAAVSPWRSRLSAR